MEIYVVLNVILILQILLLNTRVKLFSTNPSLLAFPIVLYIFVLTIPAVNLITLGDAGMSFGAESMVGEGARVQSYSYTYMSVILLLGFLYLFSFLSPLNIKVKPRAGPNVRFMYFLSAISGVVLVLKLASVQEIPIVLALTGDYLGAAEAKARILQNIEGIGGMGIGYVLRSYIFIVYIAVLLNYLKHRSGLKLLVINIAIAIVLCVYDLQKYTLVYFALLNGFVLMAHFKSFVYTLSFVVLAFGLALGGFIVSFEGDFNQLVLGALSRIFVAQAEGTYYIYQFLTPSISTYGAYGFPFAKYFELRQIDPAAEVIPILFPTAGEGWVNANTYFQAHAWAIFGPLSLLIAPLIVSINIAIVFLISRRMIVSMGNVGIALAFVIISRLPIANNFSDFLYFKPVVDISINVLFFYLLYKIFRLLGIRPVSSSVMSSSAVSK